MTDLSLLFLTVLKYANNIDYSVKKVLYRKEIKVMLKKEMSLHDYYYDLPEELIAQDPEKFYSVLWRWTEAVQD